MSPVRDRPGPAVLAAMACSGVIAAQFIAGKAARDAFFLTQFDVTSLPTMVVATSLTSIGIAVLGARLLRAFSPSSLIPLGFLASAAFFIAARGRTASGLPRFQEPQAPHRTPPRPASTYIQGSSVPPVPTRVQPSDVATPPSRLVNVQTVPHPERARSPLKRLRLLSRSPWALRYSASSALAQFFVPQGT